MKRHFLLGVVDPDGTVRPACTGHGCEHRACDCELSAELAPDADRTISPLTTIETSTRSRDVVVAVIAFALFAFGLWVWPK